MRGILLLSRNDSEYHEIDLPYPDGKLLEKLQGRFNFMTATVEQPSSASMRKDLSRELQDSIWKEAI